MIERIIRLIDKRRDKVIGMAKKTNDNGLYGIVQGLDYAKKIINEEKKKKEFKDVIIK